MMGAYSYLIAQMTWSYSRLKCFEDCPYRFMLTYIYPSEKCPQFYAEYGSLIHQLLADYYSGKISREQLVPGFITAFYQKVKGNIGSDIRKKFFDQGLQCMRRVEPCTAEIIGIEKKINFDLEGYHFVGFIDMLVQTADGKLVVVDHKSRPLKPRSKRQKPTKADEELNDYLRQLYLYSVWVEQEYGRLPDELVFHCYRTGDVIREAFDSGAYESAKQWALSVIHLVEAEETFAPILSYFPCHFLCDVHEDCVYYEMGG